MYLISTPIVYAVVMSNLRECYSNIWYSKFSKRFRRVKPEMCDDKTVEIINADHKAKKMTNVVERNITTPF